MSNWGTLVKSQCPHKYGPLNVATAVDSGLGGGIILLFCAWLCGWSRVQRYRYRLLPFTTLLPTHCLGAVGGDHIPPPADHCSLAMGPCSTRLPHLSIIWWYLNDPSTMPLLTLPFYISNDFLFSAALLAGEQLAWRRGPRLDNDEIKFQKWNSNEIFLASSLIPNMGAAALSLCHCGTQPCCGTCIQINQNMTAKYEIQLWIKGLSFLQITQTKIFTIFIATRPAK